MAILSYGEQWRFWVVGGEFELWGTMAIFGCVERFAAMAILGVGDCRSKLWGTMAILGCLHQGHELWRTMAVLASGGL